MRNSAVLPVLGVATAVVAYYAYTAISVNSGLLSQLESVFLLNVSIGSMLAVTYSMLAGRLPRVQWGASFLLNLRIPVIIVSASLTISLLWALFAFPFPWLIIPTAGAGAFAALAALKMWPVTRSIQTPKVRPLTEDWATAFVSRRPRLRVMAEERAEGFKRFLLLSGSVGNPYVMAAKAMAYSVIGAAVSIPAAVALAVFVHPAFMLGIAVPGVVYLLPVIELKDRADTRRTGCEKELPFFAMVAGILNDVGVPLHEAFQSVIGRGIFPTLEKEALLLARNIKMLGMYPVQALEVLSKNHPSRAVSVFINGYTSKARSGGDISLYLRSKGEEMLRMMGILWENYGGRVGDLGSVSLSVIVILPILVLMMSVFMSSNSLVMMYVFTFIVLPSFTIIIYYMAVRLQPKVYDRIGGNARTSLVLAFVGASTSPLGQPWLTAASMIFLFSTLYGYTILQQRREIKEDEEALVPFLSDLTDYKKQEYDINKALVLAAKENRYSPHFDGMLREVAAQVNLNRTLGEVEVRSRSWLTRMVFYILSQTASTGGGTPETLDALTSHIAKVMEAKVRARLAMRPFMMIAYMAPVFLSLGTAFATSVLQSFASSMHPVVSEIPKSLNFNFGTVPPELTQLASIFIVLASASLGLVAAKSVDFTVKNTLRISVNVLVAIGATLVLSTFNLSGLFRF